MTIERPIVAGGLWLVSATLALAQTSFHGLGTLPSQYNEIYATALSPDGGTASEDGVDFLNYVVECFIWRSASGASSIGTNALARGLSTEGAVIVGGLLSSDGNSYQPFRWTSSSGYSVLGSVPGGDDSGGFAHAVSQDGTVIAGSADGFGFRWTAASGMVNLGRYPGMSVGGSTAIAISADGSTIVGGAITDLAQNFTQAIVWRSNGDVIGLGALPGAQYQLSIANGVSSDGSVVVGASSSMGNYSEAFRWTEETGMVDIGYGMDSETDTIPYAVSADGKIVVGQGNQGAIIYDPEHGFRGLMGVLIGLGVQTVQGWSLDNATAISADGQTILGYGRDNHGHPEAWIAQIPRTLSPCPGDTNGDRKVDLSDLALTLSEYGEVQSGLPGDFNSDGQVDLSDLATLLAVFGDVCP